MQADNDELMTVVDVEACLTMLAQIYEDEPPADPEQVKDRKDTESALRKMLKNAERRDRAASLLSGGWNSLSEGSPIPR